MGYEGWHPTALGHGLQLTRSPLNFTSTKRDKSLLKLLRETLVMENEWQEDEIQVKKARGRRRALTPSFLTLTYFGWSQALATNT